MRPLLEQNKKAQEGFITWFFIIVVLLGVSIFLLVINYAWGEIQTPLDTGLSNAMPENGVNISRTLGQTGSGIAFFDNLLPFLLIGLFGFVMISAGAIVRSPIMIFVGVIIFGVLITLSVVYSNVYGNLLDSPLSGASDSVTIGGLFMRYLPMIIVAGIVLVVIAVSTQTSGGSQL